jgi:REP element-mobilizing transposase RayT
MSRWHNWYLDGCAHFCTTTVAGWEARLVGDAKSVVYEEWEGARQAYAVRVLAFVVMPAHSHLLLWAQRGASVRTFLQHTLANTSRRLQRGGGFWKERPRVLGIWSRRVLEIRRDYIHDNPVRGELVQRPEDWLDSSFRELELGATDVPFRCDSGEGIGV